MARTAVPTSNVNDILTAAWQNTYVKDNEAEHWSRITQAIGYPADGRLTLETGVPLSMTSQNAKATLYYTPFVGDKVCLYDSGESAWKNITFTEISLSLAGLSANKKFDIFCYSNSGTATLEALEWTDETTRATALARVNGVLVKDGTTTRRYLGTIRINATGGQTDDSVDKRYVYNEYNDYERYRKLWLGNAKPTYTSGCAVSVDLEMTTNKNMYDYLAFDASTDEYAYVNVPMPNDYNGGTVYGQFYWTHPATSSDFATKWSLSGVGFADDDTLDAAQGTAGTAIDTGGTTYDLYISPATGAITLAGAPLAGELINWRVGRLGTSTDDTLAVDAYLMGVMVWYPVAST